MADLVGATGDANARVFGCFFLGLALGAASVSRFIHRLGRPWRAAAVIETGIALLSIPALQLNLWSAPIWPTLGPEKLIGWQGNGAKWLLSFLVILLPAILVGMTLPVLVSAVGGPEKSSSRNSVWLYAVYTLGGALGTAVILGAALPALGVRGSMLLMMGFNLVAAGLCFGRERAPRGAEPAVVERPAPMATHKDLPPGTLLVTSLFSGAGVLALEVLGLQLLNLKAPLAFYTPGAILCCAVLLLAVSAAAVAVLERFFKGPSQELVFCTALAGTAIAGAPLLFLAITSGRSGIGIHSGSFTASLLHLAGVTCFSIGPAVLVAGMVFPLLICGLGANTSSARSGFARLLAVNGVGGLLGAEAAHRFLLPWLGIHLALGVLGAAYGLVSLALAAARHRRTSLSLTFSIGSLAATGLLLATALREAPVFFRGATFNVVQLRSGREGTLAVAERQDVGRAMFLDNHYMLGCTAGTPEMQRQAHLPLLLHPEPKLVCFIGLGTGITAAGALKHAAVESSEVIELCPLVAEAAQRHFAEFNSGVCGHPQVRVLVEDARTYISAAQRRFDVIIGDLFTPWRPGEARLCSLEQFRAAKAALRPGGIFCQWLPMTQLTREHFDMIARTFRQAFGEVHLFRSDFQTRSLPVALVGFKDSALDWEMVSRRCDFERTRGILRDPLARHAEGLALLYLGTYQGDQAAGQTLNTLDNLCVEVSAGRHLLAGNPADYFAGTDELWSGFVRKQMAGLETEQGLPGQMRGLPRLGLAIAQWQNAQETGAPNAQELRREVLAGLPGCILADTNADWSLWARGELITGGK